MPKDVRSPWSREKGDPHPRLAESPGSRSSPSNAARSDSGHLAHTVGKGGHGPASVRRDGAVPVVGGESAANLQQALNRGDRR
jgi:hypothetical protein